MFGSNGVLGGPCDGGYTRSAEMGCGVMRGLGVMVLVAEVLDGAERGGRSVWVVVQVVGPRAGC